MNQFTLPNWVLGRDTLNGSKEKKSKEKAHKLTTVSNNIQSATMNNAKIKTMNEINKEIGIIAKYDGQQVSRNSLNNKTPQSMLKRNQKVH